MIPICFGLSIYQNRRLSNFAAQNLFKRELNIPALKIAENEIIEYPKQP